MTDADLEWLRDFGFAVFEDAHWMGAGFDAIPACHVLKMLREAPVVYLDKEENGWHAGERVNAGKTHTARLIGIKEIKKDSAESLLRELVEGYDKDQYQYGTKIHDGIERARRLLEGK